MRVDTISSTGNLWSIVASYFDCYRLDVPVFFGIDQCVKQEWKNGKASVTGYSVFFFFFPLMLCHLIVEESYREHLEVQLLTFI